MKKMHLKGLIFDRLAHGEMKKSLGGGGTSNCYRTEYCTKCGWIGIVTTCSSVYPRCSCDIRYIVVVDDGIL